MANEENILLLLKQLHEDFCSKTPRCRELSHSSEMQNVAMMHREGLKYENTLLAKHDYNSFRYFLPYQIPILGIEIDVYSEGIVNVSFLIH